VNTHPFDLKFVLFWSKFSRDSDVELYEKNYFGRLFQKFCANQGYHLPKLVKFRHAFCNFFLGPDCAKKISQVLLYVVSTHVRGHVHKQITKTTYSVENPGRFVFGKPVLFILGLGLTTPYSLGILVWNFYQTLVIVSIEFWLRSEPQIRPTRFAINFVIHHCQNWKEGSFVCETVLFFSEVNTHPFGLKFFACCPKFSRDSYVELQEKTISGEFFSRNEGFIYVKNNT